jgi:hypothetical protein
MGRDTRNIHRSAMFRKGLRGGARSALGLGQEIKRACVLNTACTGLFHQSVFVHKKAPRRKTNWSLGRIRPSQTIPDHMDYPADHTPVVHARNATRPREKGSMRLT